VSSTNKTGCHDITENTIILPKSKTNNKKEKEKEKIKTGLYIYVP
jgi:hypothetical protein